MTIEELTSLEGKNKTLYCGSRKTFCTFKELEKGNFWAWVVIEGFRSKVRPESLSRDHNILHENLVSRREKIMRGATKTDTPCGAASCWEATGMVCHCSCAGYNHGISHETERSEEYQSMILTKR